MTATVLDNDLDIDSLEALDFDHEVPCESMVGCDNVAKWKVHIKCHGENVLLCQDCVDEMLDWFRWTKKSIKCLVCKTKGMTPDEFVELTKL